MTETILGGLWKSALNGLTDPIEVHKQFMTQIGNYITSNVTFSISFKGTLIEPPHTPITTVDIATLNGLPVSSIKVSFEDPKGGDGYSQWLNWMNQVYRGISTTLVTGNLTIPIGTILAFPTLLTPTWDRSSLLSVHQSNWDDPQDAIMDELARNIISDMKSSYIKSYPAIYSAVYTGVATVESIITL